MDYTVQKVREQEDREQEIEKGDRGNKRIRHRRRGNRKLRTWSRKTEPGGQNQENSEQD